MTRDDIFADATYRAGKIWCDWQAKLGHNPDDVSKARDLVVMQAHIDYHLHLIKAYEALMVELRLSN